MNHCYLDKKIIFQHWQYTVTDYKKILTLTSVIFFLFFYYSPFEYKNQNYFIKKQHTFTLSGYIYIKKNQEFSFKMKIIVQFPSYQTTRILELPLIKERMKFKFLFLQYKSKRDQFFYFYITTFYILPRRINNVLLVQNTKHV